MADRRRTLGSGRGGAPHWADIGVQARARVIVARPADGPPTGWGVVTRASYQGCQRGSRGGVVLGAAAPRLVEGARTGVAAHVHSRRRSRPGLGNGVQLVRQEAAGIQLPGHLPHQREGEKLPHLPCPCSSGKKVNFTFGRSYALTRYAVDRE